MLHITASFSSQSTPFNSAALHRLLDLCVEVCMGVGNPMEIPFPWDSHGNGNSHTAHDGNGNRNGNKASGNGNSIYFTRVKIPKIIVMPLKSAA